MDNKVLVLGYFGYASNQLDGQTVKTRSVYELLKSKEEEIGTLSYFDTQQFKYSKLSFMKMISSLINCNKLIYLPAHNNLKYIFPLLFIISKLKKIDIIYIVIGGWVEEFLHSKKLHIAMLSNIKGIFTESNQMTNNLIVQYNFSNVITFPNFRIHTFIPSFKKENDTFKIAYMARIFREKGIDVVFRLADYIQKTYGNQHSISIDFYGPIQKDEEDYFRAELEKHDFVRYKCVLEPDQIYRTLEQYDVVVLPTRFFTEGFPGTVMDAYISGVPVIVTKWKYASEFVNHGNSGFIFDLNKEEDFYSYFDCLYKDRTQLLKMKHGAYQKSKEYSSETAWQILKRYLVT